MALNWQRPILVGGIGLSLALWLLDSLQHSVSELGEVTLLGLMASGVGFWWLQQRSKPLQLTPTPAPANREAAEKAIAQVQTVLNLLAAEAPNSDANPKLQAQLSQLTAELDRQNFRLSITGGKAVGKTALLQALQSHWLPPSPQTLSILETAPLFTQTEANPNTASDLVLFVTAGDITDSEFKTLSQLAQERRVLLVWNKQDQYLPTQQSQIWQHLQQRMQGILAPEDVLAIASSPSPLKVRQHQPDGTLQERMENQPPQIQPLTERLTQILTQESQQLVCAHTLRSAAMLKLEAKSYLNGVRRDRALPLIEQYQWIAAAAAFANPVAALDLLATAAISTQLVIDLGAIYQQKFSLDQAKAVAGTLASQMLKLGLVELSTQTLAGLLKTNTITFVAGGVVQGASAAYLTRIAGLSLIEYFQAQDPTTPADVNALNLNLGKILQTVFQQNQQITFLHSFIKQVANRLSPGSIQLESAKSTAS